MASLFFRATGIAEYVRVFHKTPIKFHKAKYLQPVKLWGKRRVEKLLKPQQIRTLETLLQKVKVTRQDLDILLRLNLLYLWEYLPFFLVSPGCCTLVCTPTGVCKKEGGPRSSHYFAFQKILSTIYVYGDGNTTCILIRNLHKKSFDECYTD